jgi:hypothetical protein
MNPSAFSKIDWSKGPYFIRGDIDGTILGCSQIMSVPYAFHANTADSLITKHYVGELYGGGVVFYVDHTGNHGLICSEVEMGYMPWSNVASANIGIDNQLGQGLFNGKVNSEAIVSQPGHTTSAAKACLDYVNENYGTGIYDDWYLPSQGEFLLLWNNSMLVQKALSKDTNPNTWFYDNYYWTSTESDQNQGRLFYFCYGYFGWDLKTNNYSVRPIRAF